MCSCARCKELPLQTLKCTTEHASDKKEKCKKQLFTLTEGKCLQQQTLSLEVSSTMKFMTEGLTGFQTINMSIWIIKVCVYAEFKISCMDNEFWKTAFSVKLTANGKMLSEALLFRLNISALFMEHVADIKICLATKLKE